MFQIGSRPLRFQICTDSLHHLWPGWLLELDMAGLVEQVAAKTQPVKPQEPTAPTPTPAQPAEESTVEKKSRT